MQTALFPHNYAEVIGQMTLAFQFAFWACIGAIVYNYVGYPFVLYLLGALVQAKSDFEFLIAGENRRRPQQASYKPSVAVLVAAFNEEVVIEGRIRNLLEISYPSDLIEILIGLDSPTDSTSLILSQFRSTRVRVFKFPKRRGKLAVLRDLAQQTSAEILLLTDAETMFAPDCVQKLVQHFADPAVGAVGGQLRVLDRDGNVPVEGVYWRYELLLKSLESKLNCVVGMVGSLYAVRSALFHAQRPSFAEDFQLPMQIRVSGRRVIYEPAALAVETATPTFAAEFRRRIRLGAADYQILTHNFGFFNPLNGFVTFSYVSHKVLRWLGPFLLLTVLISNLCLISKPIYCGLLLVQSGLYAMASLGFLLATNGKSHKFLAIPFYFFSMNLALLCGFFRFLTGRQSMAWDPTVRTFESVSASRPQAYSAISDFTRGNRTATSETPGSEL